MTMYRYGDIETNVKPEGWTTVQDVFDSRYRDYVMTLTTDDSDIRRASIEKDLEDDARELSEIDGMPAPGKLNITSSTTPGDLLWELPSKSWISSATAKTTVIIPAGTRFVQDPDTGELTNVDEIVVEV